MYKQVIYSILNIEPVLDCSLKMKILIKSKNKLRIHKSYINGEQYVQ